MDDADALYRLRPAEFTAARDAAAKQARLDGDRPRAAALSALRRPSVAAWLLNRLVAAQRERVVELFALGPALTQAQTGGDAAVLRDLDAQRRALVEAVTRAAVEGADGAPVPAAVREQVAATLQAALADPLSAQALLSGRLVRALSYAGFGPVDLAGAVASDGDLDPRDGCRTLPGDAGDARPGPPRERRPAVCSPGSGVPSVGRRAEPASGGRPGTEVPEPGADVQALEQVALEAAGALDDAARVHERARGAAAAAERQQSQTAAEHDRLQDRLDRGAVERDRLQAARDTLTAEQERLQGELELVRHRLQATSAELDAATAQRHRLGGELDTATDRMVAAQRRLAGESATVRKADQALRRARERAETARARLDDLRRGPSNRR